MIVRFSFMQRLDEMTQDAFTAYWRDVHVPLALKLKALQFYQMNIVNGAVGANGNIPLWPVNGVVQLGFNDLDVMWKNGPTAAGVADQKYFMQGFRTIVAKRGKPLLGPEQPESSVKALVYLSRRAHDTEGAFLDAWRGGYVSGLKDIPGIAGYRQSEILQRWSGPWTVGTYEDMPIDAIEEIWFDDVGALEAACAPNGALHKRRDGFCGPSTTLSTTAVPILAAPAS